LGAKSRVAKTAVKEPVNAVTGGGFAAEPSSDDVEFILVDEVSDTRKADASDFRGSIKEIRGNVLETKELSEVFTTDRVNLS